MARRSAQASGADAVKPHVRFDHSWIESHKLLAACEELRSDAPVSIWTKGVTHCNRSETDGKVGGATLRRFTFHKDPKHVLAVMVKHGVLVDLGEDMYEIHDYLKHNNSKAEIEAHRAKKKANGSAGGRRSAEVRAASKDQAGASQDSSTGQAVASALVNSPQAEQQHPYAAVAAAVVSRSRGGGVGEATAEPPRLTRSWLLAEFQRHPALEPIASPDFAQALLGGLMANPKPLDVVSQAIADAALHSAGLSLTPEALQRKVGGYVNNARRRPAPVVETRCPAPTDEGVIEWLEGERLPALSSRHGADVALMLAHYAERAQTSANWLATWTKWAASDKPHPSGPAPGHKPRRPRAETEEVPIASVEERAAALAKLRGALASNDEKETGS